MRTCDVAVVGLGLMGSAALDALLTAGVDALGFDPLGPGSNRGSPHGSCRVFRRFNFENDNYTDLSDAALAGWKRLESAISILLSEGVGPNTHILSARRRPRPPRHDSGFVQSPFANSIARACRFQIPIQ
jgi:glycine/D-amino acid oxidase-like deaminating enzyme